MIRARRGRIASAVALALALAGCGIKGPPQPPEAVRPERILNLAASPDSAGIRLTWSRPERYTKGATMRDLAGFVVMRAQDDEPLKPLVDLPITDRERFRKQTTLDWVDTTTEMGAAYRYAVVSMTDDGYRSEPSNVVQFTRIVPPPPSNPENFALPKPSPLP